ncbi:MAG: DoxX family protein [Chlorobi bacterium]|nr:DoxX family protein [Chlorobiota bacterium]
MKLIKLFLRIAIALGFLSAVVDRFGFWAKDVSAWGNWDSFLEYTQLINPWMPSSIIPFVGVVVTVIEIVCAVSLLIGFKVELFSKISGFLLLLFAIAMITSTGIKGVFDYSVLSASAGAFALSQLRDKYLEIG